MVALACLAVWCVGTTLGAFSGVTTNPNNSFQASSSFGGACPSVNPTHVWMSGIETGYSTSAGGGMFAPSVGTASVDSTIKRSGNYSLRLAPAATTAYRTRIWGVTLNPVVERFAIRLESLPTSDVELAGMTVMPNQPPTTELSFKYRASTQKFALTLGTGTVDATTSPVQAGVWYLIEARFDPTANPHTADWRIDNVAQPSPPSYAAAAADPYYIYWGSGSAATFTANYDDLMYSFTGSDYPLGDGKILALKPNAMGTSVGAGNFQNELGGAIDANSWNRLDDVPMQNSTDYIKQVTASSTSYLEVNFDDTVETCIRAVHGWVVFDPQNTNQANASKTSAFDGATESVIDSGDNAANNSVFRPVSARVAPAAGTWTPAALNGLVMRIGYATDVSPVTMWHSLLLEYDVPQ